MRIGIDFDNTLATYDHLFMRTAQEWKLLPAGFQGGKRAVRDTLRQGDKGDEMWTRLQAEVYGPRMRDAELAEGARLFLEACRDGGIDTVVVSHKTRFAVADQSVDLHGASLAWMEMQGFFAADGFRLAPGKVHFEPTRGAKCARIAALGCTHFIDDLEEVFLEAEFPAGVERLLYCPENGLTPLGPFTVYRSWQAIQDAIFS